MTPSSASPIRILVAALGGEGGGVLAEWLVEAASAAGLIVQSTSIPGVAQRTGATTYYVEIFPEAASALGDRRPVLGLYPIPGAVDLLVASELLEAGRMLQAGMVSPDRTILVTSTSRTLTTAEKMALGDGRFSSERLLEAARAQSRTLVAFDMEATARRAGTAVSAVMLGTIAGSARLPIARPVFEEVIRASGVGVEGSLRGFSAGVDAIAGTPATLDPSPAVRSAGAPRSPAHSPLPVEIAPIVALGETRLVEFQDERYAALYRERVARILAAERAADPDATHGHALTREVARFLALWMAFDDVVRVAYLKSRASRFARVREEVKAQPGDIVRIVDYFKPGVPELAGLLPPRLARRLVAWDGRRKARGREPWAFALHLRSDGMLGLVLLRILAGMRFLRRGGSRYLDEQARIEAWLGAVEGSLREGWTLAHEIALCGRLVKGYGETNERGKRNLAHILEHLAAGTASVERRARAIRETREAALADEAGTTLDATLVRHGAPSRPVVAQPIRWMKRSAQSTATRPASDPTG